MFWNFKSSEQFVFLHSEMLSTFPQSSEFYKVTTEEYQKAAEEVEAKFK